MVSIAREILLHDKLRFLIIVISLGFVITMIVYDLGMFFGVTGDSVSLVDRAHAELWISEEESENLLSPSLVPGSALRRARMLEGVNQACGLDYSAGNLKINDTRQVTVVGIDPSCPLFQPWEIASGDVGQIHRKDTIVIDDLALRGDNLAQLGDIVELNGEELRLVAITHNNKSFSSPFVYVNFHTFEELFGTTGYHSFVAVQLEPGVEANTVLQRLAGVNFELTVTPAQQFRQSTIIALVSAGVGMIFVVVFIGVVVGMLIITLTLYTATMEQLRDFAILKALGSTRGKIRLIVLEQAILETTASFAIGLAGTWGANYFVENISGIRGRFPTPAVLASFGLMIGLAVLGSLLSIRKATRVDPVMVFRA